MIFFVCILLTVIAFFPLGKSRGAAEQNPLSVVRVSPQGDICRTNLSVAFLVPTQITFPLGDHESPSPSQARYSLFSLSKEICSSDEGEKD